MGKDKQIRRIGVFTSGGDAPGMNAAIRAVVRTALHMGIECIGIRRGYHGLINGDFTPLTFESVSGLSRRGGTMLYSARSEDFKAKLGQEKAMATCKLLGLDALVGIGGDGTFRGLLALAQQGIQMIYDETHMVLAQGNFVLAVSEGTYGGAPTSYYDLWRVENGKIAEHWDVMETIADQSTWQNDNGKF